MVFKTGRIILFRFDTEVVCMSDKSDFHLEKDIAEEISKADGQEENSSFLQVQLLRMIAVRSIVLDTIIGGIAGGILLGRIGILLGVIAGAVIGIIIARIIVFFLDKAGKVKSDFSVIINIQRALESVFHPK